MTTFADKNRNYEKIQNQRYQDKLLAEDKADFEVWLDEQEELFRQERLIDLTDFRREEKKEALA